MPPSTDIVKINVAPEETLVRSILIAPVAGGNHNLGINAAAGSPVTLKVKF